MDIARCDHDAEQYLSDRRTRNRDRQQRKALGPLNSREPTALLAPLRCPQRSWGLRESGALAVACGLVLRSPRLALSSARTAPQPSPPPGRTALTFVRARAPGRTPCGCWRKR